MKKFLGLLSSVSLVLDPAFAADLAVRPPVYKALPIAAPFNWTGCYVGATAGVAEGRSDASWAANPTGFPSTDPPSLSPGASPGASPSTSTGTSTGTSTTPGTLSGKGDGGGKGGKDDQHSNHDRYAKGGSNQSGGGSGQSGGSGSDKSSGGDSSGSGDNHSAGSGSEHGKGDKDDRFGKSGKDDQYSEHDRYAKGGSNQPGGGSGQSGGSGSDKSSGGDSSGSGDNHSAGSGSEHGKGDKDNDYGTGDRRHRSKSYGKGDKDNKTGTDSPGSKSGGDSPDPPSPPTLIPGFAAGTGDAISAQTGRSLNSTGFTGGAELGCNWQANPWLVLGIEGDWQYTGLDGSASGVVSVGGTVNPFTESFRSRWLSTIRGRVGVANGQWLFFATGGFAFADANFSDFIAFSNGTFNAASSSGIMTGWTVGGGVEWFFAPRWSAKAEYLHVDLGTRSFTSVNSNPAEYPLAVISHSHSLVEDIGRFGVNYHF